MIAEKRGQILRIFNEKFQKRITEYHQARGSLEQYTLYRENFEKTQFRQYERPLELILELNNYCNLMCKMCYRNYRSITSKKEMSDELFHKIISNAIEMKIPAIRIGAYSEATLCSNIKERIKQISDAGFLDFWMSTNGTKLGDKKLVETIVKSPVTHLCVSLDAATPGTYRLIRGGNLCEIENNIFEFLKMRNESDFGLPILRISFVDMRENHHELNMFINKWKNIADIIDIQTYVENNPSLQKPSLYKKKYDFSCAYPLKSLLVCFDGELRPCSNTLYVTDTPLYLGKDYESIFHYWSSDWHREFSERIIAHKFENICKECEWRTGFMG